MQARQVTIEVRHSDLAQYHAHRIQQAAPGRWSLSRFRLSIAHLAGEWLGIQAGVFSDPQVSRKAVIDGHARFVEQLQLPTGEAHAGHIGVACDTFKTMGHQREFATHGGEHVALRSTQRRLDSGTREQFGVVQQRKVIQISRQQIDQRHLHDQAVGVHQ